MNSYPFWQNLDNKVAELTLRERAMILCVGLFMFCYPAWTQLLTPWWQKTDQQLSQIAGIEKQLKNNKELIELMEFQLTTNPNQLSMEKRNRLSEENELKNQELKNQSSTLLGPAEMTLLLEEVLKSSKALTLLEVNSIAPQVLIDLGNSKEKTENLLPQIKVYSHGVQLTLSGGYFDLLEYLQKLEALPQRFFWRRFDYQVDQYPKARVKIEIYTLSTEKEFIGG